MKDPKLTEVVNTGKPLEMKRAIAVRMVMSGWMRLDVAEALDVSVAFVDKWKREYFENGAGALNLRYKGSRGYLSNEQRQSVLSWINEKETVSVDEIHEYIMNLYSVEYKTRKSYTDLIHEAGFAWKKTGKTNPKRDEALIEAKKKEIQQFCGVHRDDIEKGRIIIWMQDECHQLWGDCCGYAWGKKGVRLAVPMTNFRERQTWYGALNCYTGEFMVAPYEGGNTKNTVSFVESLYRTAPEARHLIIWDGASYHRSDELKKYLAEKNDGLSKDEYKITCMLFAPNAPEQNSVEDVWLRAKTEVRRCFSEIKVFDDAKGIFERFLEDTRFFFAKTKAYVCL